MYVARDRDGGLFLFENKPWRQTNDKMWLDSPIYLDYKYDGTGCIRQLDPDLYPGLKWEDEPIKIEKI